MELTVMQECALREMNISELNGMQRAALEHCRNKRDMVLLSPTGTGKTLAGLLPLLEKLENRSEGVRALIVSPSRELAQQTAEVWRSMNTDFAVVALHGGRPVVQEAVRLENASPTIVVGTPGRLVDHLNRKNFSVDNCTVLIIDEFDKCLELGFLDEMEKLLSMLPSVEFKYLLSATDCDEIPRFTGADVACRLDFRDDEAGLLHRLSFYKLTTTPEERLKALFALLCSFGNEQAVVFCNFRETVDEVGRYLAKNKLFVSAYHGAMEQKERELALFRFSSGCSNILVCTDLASRGLDIDSVRHVVHFQRSMSADIFTHRNGRTARWEAEGSVYLICYREHSLPEFVPQGIAEFKLSRKAVIPDVPDMVALYIGKGKRDKISRGDLLGFLVKKGGLLATDVGMMAVNERCSYVAVKRGKVRDLLKKVSGEKIKGIKTIIEIARN